MIEPIPTSRLRVLHDRPANPEGRHVLYWMIASRRTTDSFALQHALHQAAARGQPLLVLEALRVDYRWASARLHRFVIDGMRDNAARFEGHAARYHPYVEPAPGAGRGLLEALAAEASVVVTDDYPCFFLARMVAAASRSLPTRLELVDGNGLYPMRATERVFARAHDFRRHLQKELRAHLAAPPMVDPLGAVELPPAALPGGVLGRWPAASQALLEGRSTAFEELPIDHGVPVVSSTPGGEAAGQARLRRFLEHGLDGYGARRRDLNDDAQSGLSPYLHFGHVGAHAVLRAVAGREGQDVATVGGHGPARGRREGWWGLGAGAEAFLDQMVCWRELGFNRCAHDARYDAYASLPDWARTTLAAHAGDVRPHVYDRATFEAAQTHDPIWNAAQRQLLREGRIHNYLRMLWGKKILHWSATPEAALETMTRLNNRHALDGQDPNSYSGIFWCLGRYDRAWGPVRPVFGKIRYMSSDSTRRKLRLGPYLATYGPGD